MRRAFWTVSINTIAMLPRVQLVLDRADHAGTRESEIGLATRSYVLIR